MALAEKIKHRFDEEGKIRMHTFWAGFWTVWNLSLVFLVFAGLKEHPYLVATLFFVFFIGEGQGALRRRWGGEEGSKYWLGDTLSEYYWWFQQGEYSRRWIGYAQAVCLGYLIAYMPYVFGSPVFWEALPAVFIGFGVGAWLMAHFSQWNELLYKGKTPEVSARFGK